jgi:hypothetical protein
MITLQDYQTLLENPNGVNTEVTDVFSVKNNDIDYKFEKLDCNLVVVTRTLKGKEPEKFVCYEIANDEAGEDLLIENGEFVSTISSDEVTIYNLLHSFLDCKVVIGNQYELGRIVTYKSDQQVDNNYIFGVETVGEHASYFEVYCGYLVSLKDVKYYD